MSAHALPAADEDLAALIAARTPQSLEGAHVACTQLYARHAPSLLSFLARHVSVAELGRFALGVLPDLKRIGRLIRAMPPGTNSDWPASTISGF